MSKINQVLLNWKTGDVHGIKWLRERVLSRRHSYHYLQMGIFHKLGPAVFSQSGDEVDWRGIIRFLQKEERLPIHVSKKTALELHGHGHYVPLGEKERVEVTSFERINFPKWTQSLDYPYTFVFRKSSLLSHECFLSECTENGFQIFISYRELAILELIDSIDLSYSLETAENYMNALTTLRPDVVQRLLEKCRSIKAKRVFLYLADKLNLPFFKKLDLDKISLGSGKRMIVKGGELNKKYQITVDRDYGENQF